jgi:release factor glutamine methyltransferase
MPPDTIASVLREGRRLLEEANIESAALDARLLLQEATGLTHENLVAEPAQAVGESAYAAYRVLIDRRRGHEPVSRIIGTREFYGRAFVVTPAVLDPRPDTETLVEAALSLLPAGVPRRILDLGTGSGAIIVTLLKERPLALGVATDWAPAALAVALKNAERHGVESRLTLIETSWWQGFIGSFDLIVSNPPYIAHSVIAALPEEVRNFDPAKALDGGPDGLEAYRRIAAGAGAHLVAGGRILLEIGVGQADSVAEIFGREGLAGTGQWADLSGKIRGLGFACDPQS